MNLQEAIEQYGSHPFILTVSEEGPHAGIVELETNGNSLACAIGKSAMENIADNSNISFLWPPLEDNGYSLIVNGIASISDGICTVDVTKSVLHRPGAPTKPGCTADCIRLTNS